MSQHIDAIYINGVFRPEQPVNLVEGERVSLQVDTLSAEIDDLTDIRDLIDHEFVARCRRNVEGVTSLKAVRDSLSAYRGVVADLILEDRQEQ